MWMLAVVRRMQRPPVDEVTVGAEIIAGGWSGCCMRRGSTPADDAVAAPSGPSSGSIWRRIRTIAKPRSAA